MGQAKQMDVKDLERLRERVEDGEKQIYLRTSQGDFALAAEEREALAAGLGALIAARTNPAPKGDPKPSGVTGSGHLPPPVGGAPRSIAVTQSAGGAAASTTSEPPPMRLENVAKEREGSVPEGGDSGKTPE
jgi:hypothetical protein